MPRQRIEQRLALRRVVQPLVELRVPFTLSRQAIDDVERGTVWEEALLFCPPQVRVVGLSATVPNVEELGRWIGKPGRMVAAVTDDGFTQMIKRALAQDETQPKDK